VKLVQAQMDAFGKALDAYRLDVGRYPGTEEGLDALVSRPHGSDKWQGPYLQSGVPQDPWGRAYGYRSPGSDGRDYEISTSGRDGAPGGEGDNADLRSWR
jgi:general secretion pathway protein G